MKPTQFSTTAQAYGATAEQPVSGPVLIDPALLKLVSGGSPKGGWDLDPVVIEQTSPTPSVGWA